MQDQNSSIFPERNIVYAGFWERVAAIFLDGLILMIPHLAITFLVSGSLFGSSTVASALTFILDLLYFTYFESSARQATPGKLAMNIKVTNMEGGRISFAQAMGRYFSKILSAIILFIGYLMMLWNDKKQTLHDKIANTLVVSQSSSF